MPQTPAKSPLPRYESPDSTIEEITLTSPAIEGPQPGIHPGPGWMTNNKGAMHHPEAVIQGEVGEQAAAFVFYDMEAETPQLLTMQGCSCYVHTFPLHARPDPYPCRVLTCKEEFRFQDREMFSPLVNLAIKAEGDLMLQAEVQTYHTTHQHTKRLAVHMAQLKEEYTTTWWDLCTSAKRLANANTYGWLEPQVIMDLQLNNDLTATLCDKAILMFVDSWMEESCPKFKVCQWCKKSGHNAQRCPWLNKCLLCGKWGHMEKTCFMLHAHCRKGQVCQVL
jgi:hypothetical protein